MKAWLDGLGFRDYNLTPASADASFRSYHRLIADGRSLIVMDAPPEKEPCDQFIKVAQKIRAAGLNAPEIIEQNLLEGFLLLSDLGSRDYLNLLDRRTEASLYADAMDALLGMQINIDSDDLPAYDIALLNREMDLFYDWLIPKQLGLVLDQSQSDRWQAIKQTLIDNALAQPQVFVHRDYHSRNLMALDLENPGIIDFQDAVKGPITYDLVSLLRDCYISWPLELVERKVKDFHQAAIENQLTDVDFSQFLRWFNLMGIQRHLKAAGIFLSPEYS